MSHFHAVHELVLDVFPGEMLDVRFDVVEPDDGMEMGHGQP